MHSNLSKLDYTKLNVIRSFDEADLPVGTCIVALYPIHVLTQHGGYDTRVQYMTIDKYTATRVVINGQQYTKSSASAYPRSDSRSRAVFVRMDTAWDTEGTRYMKRKAMLSKLLENAPDTITRMLSSCTDDELATVFDILQRY